jgi:hypothetical protein
MASPMHVVDCVSLRRKRLSAVATRQTIANYKSFKCQNLEQPIIVKSFNYLFLDTARNS